MQGEYEYYESISGLSDPASLDDHKGAVFGPDGEKAYYADQNGHDGNLDDLRLEYFENETGETGPLADLQWAFFN